MWTPFTSCSSFQFAMADSGNVCKCKKADNQNRSKEKSQTKSNNYCSCSQRQCSPLKRAELGTCLSCLSCLLSLFFICNFVFFSLLLKSFWHINMALLFVFVLFCFFVFPVQQCIADSTMSSDSDATIGYDSDSEPYFLTDEGSSDEEQWHPNAQVNSNKHYDLLIYFI